MLLKWILGTFAVFAAAMSMAAIPVRQAGTTKRNHYLEAGVFVGGYDHGPLSLLNVRHSVSGSGAERIVLDEGATGAKDGTERPGFFHVAIQKNPRRVVIDLEDIYQTKIKAAVLNELFQKSPYFSNASEYYDGRNKSLTIELPLRASAQIEVFELASEGKPGRIVLDVKGN